MFSTSSTSSTSPALSALSTSSTASASPALSALSTFAELLELPEVPTKNHLMRSIACAPYYAILVEKVTDVANLIVGNEMEHENAVKCAELAQKAVSLQPGVVVTSEMLINLSATDLANISSPDAAEMPVKVVKTPFDAFGALSALGVRGVIGDPEGEFMVSMTNVPLTMLSDDDLFM